MGVDAIAAVSVAQPLRGWNLRYAPGIGRVKASCPPMSGPIGHLSTAYPQSGAFREAVIAFAAPIERQSDGGALLSWSADRWLDRAR